MPFDVIKNNNTEKSRDIVGLLNGLKERLKQLIEETENFPLVFESDADMNQEVERIESIFGETAEEIGDFLEIFKRFDLRNEAELKQKYGGEFEQLTSPFESCRDKFSKKKKKVHIIDTIKRAA